MERFRRKSIPPISLMFIIPMIWLVPISATSAELGRVELNGRTIIVDSDGTWKYRNIKIINSPDNCTVLSSKKFPVQFCLKDSVWQKSTTLRQHEMNFTTKSGDLWLGVISEKIYLDSEMLKSAIVGMAENAAGLKGVDKVTHVDKVINGHKWNRTEIHVNMKSTPIVFENFHTSLKGSGSVQIVFWTTKTFFLATKSVRKDVSDSIRLLK